MSALIHVGPQNPREYTDVLSTTEPLARSAKRRAVPLSVCGMSAET